jgi:L-lactate dehydrogenase (cytochrome)/(S)-mandelate dehydrogenase
MKERDLSRYLSIEDFRQAARRRLPRAIFDFIDGGAEDELTLRDNRRAFERVRLLPRVLNDVSAPQMEGDLLGIPVKAPLVVAPMGSCMLAWPEADIAIARAATAHGVPYTLSTMSTTSIERMARAVSGSLWFQLYVLKDQAFNLQLIDRAQAHGYGALVVTVDLQAGGKREKDFRNGISIPLRPGWRLLRDGLMHPAWAWQLLRGGMPQFENVAGYGGMVDNGLPIAARVGQSLDDAFNWDKLARMRDRWSGRLLVKGVEHPEDAKRLVSMGIDGIWISNHGGRQLDGALATADALPAIAQAVPGIPLIIDSGVRRGVDVFKAKALGAASAAVGRAVLWGAAVAGEAGAHRALQILIDELRLSMKLSGAATLAELGPEWVLR